MKILFAAAEVAPFSKVGGLADVAGALPAELARSTIKTQIVSPLYRQIDRTIHEIESTGVSGSVRLEYTSHPYELFKCVDSHDPYLECLFVHNQYYFARDGIYTRQDGEGFIDNNARYIFFQKVIVDLIVRGIFNPDIIHVNDHHTALIPFLLHNRKIDIPALLTVHNFQYQGHFSVAESGMLGPNDRAELKANFTADRENYNALEIGIRYSQHTNTVSPTYAGELLEQSQMSFGLHEVLLKSRARFSGILNGADYSYWNPQVDQLIPYNYSQAAIAGKLENKQALARRCNLPFTPDIPIIGSVSRLVESKGFDLIIEIMGRISSLPVQLVFLGTGNPEYQEQLTDWAQKYPDRISYTAAYDEPLAHLIEAGSDLFLMPSRFEPCGLNQIYSLKYGTIPIVHHTGGLADTVENWTGNQGNGFVFDDYTGETLLATIHRALEVYQSDPYQWSSLMANAMRADYSWELAADKYRQLYENILKQRGSV